MSSKVKELNDTGHECSFYKNLWDTESKDTTTVEQFLHNIKEGKWKKLVNGVRAGKHEKKKLPGITTSGVFNGRKSSGLKSPSGFTCMDVDNLDNPGEQKESFAGDPFIFAAFDSASGKGLAIVFKIDPEKYDLSFDGISKYLFTQYGLIADPACRDVSRLRFVSDDPNLYLNPHAKEFDLYPSKKDQPGENIPDITFTQSEFDSIVGEIEKREIDITGDYHQWLAIAYAIAQEFGEAGRESFHRISQFADTYDHRTADRQYTACMKDSASKKRSTLATFFYYAREHGITTAISDFANDTQSQLSAYEHLRITDKTILPPLKIFLSIAGETIATAGDLIVFSGDVKTGKSSIQDPIIASALTTDGIINDQIEFVEVAANSLGKAVIHFDTEQSKHKHFQKIDGILRRVNMLSCPENFLSYNIRELNLNVYKVATTNICSAAAETYGGIHMIFIDGIADYVSSPNEETESNAIVKYFEQLAIKYECPVFVVIHTNPGGMKERGHLGSQCIRKAASVLTTKCDEDISYLEPKYLRNAGRGKVPVIQFRYDVLKRYHVSCGIKEPEAKENKSVRSLSQKIVDRVFAPPISLEYKDAITQIMFFLDRKMNVAKDRFKEMKELQLIEQGEDKRWRKATGLLV